MSGGPTFRSASRVVKGADTQSLADALVMKEQAERLLRDAQARAAQVEAEARRRGEEEGLRQGRDLALKSLSLIMANLNARFMAYENDLSQVVVVAVQRILGQTPEAAVVNGAVRHALADLVDQTSIVLLVSPEERARTEAALAEGGGLPPTIREIRSDPALSPGDMILETNHGRYNIGLRSQLQRLADGLRPSGGA